MDTETLKKDLRRMHIIKLLVIEKLLYRNRQRGEVVEEVVKEKPTDSNWDALLVRRAVDKLQSEKLVIFNPNGDLHLEPSGEKFYIESLKSWYKKLITWIFSNPRESVVLAGTFLSIILTILSILITAINIVLVIPTIKKIIDGENISDTEQMTTAN